MRVGESCASDNLIICIDAEINFVHLHNITLCIKIALIYREVCIKRIRIVINNGTIFYARGGIRYNAREPSADDHPACACCFVWSRRTFC